MWSYDVSTLTTNTKNQIRLRIGDTDANDPLLQDEEIEYFLSISSNTMEIAAYKCIDSIITRLCNLPDYTLGPYSESQSNRLKALQTVKKELSTQLIAYNFPLSEKPTTAPIFSYDLMSALCLHEAEGDNR